MRSEMGITPFMRTWDVNDYKSRLIEFHNELVFNSYPLLV
jgi:hypothetical protein